MSGSVEDAIISLVVHGSELAQQQTDRVAADLTALERAAKKSEVTANGTSRMVAQAEREADSMAAKMRFILHRATHAVSLITRAAKHVGGSDHFKAEVDVVGGAAHDAFRNASAVARLTAAFGPQVSIPAAVVAGVGTFAVETGLGLSDLARKEQAEREAQKAQNLDFVRAAIRQEIANERTQRRADLEEIMKDRAWFAMLSAQLGGSRLDR